MDLIQSIIELFGSNINSLKDRLENTLSPVYYNETEEFENAMQAIEDLLDGKSINKEKQSLIDKLCENTGIGGGYRGIKGLYTYSNAYANSKNAILKKNAEDKSVELNQLVDDLEEAGDRIIAYKSPIIEEVKDGPGVDDMVNGAPVDTDIKFIGWHFFHPNLNHTGDKYYGNGLIATIIKKIKSKIIKKAAKKSHKKNYGVNMLNKKKVKQDIAYKAFYWYTCYTEDLEKDVFELGHDDGYVEINSVVQTQNGSIVQLSDGRKVFVADNNVRSGDYVTVDGVKYRVTPVKK